MTIIRIRYSEQNEKGEVTNTHEEVFGECDFCGETLLTKYDKNQILALTRLNGQGIEITPTELPALFYMQHVRMECPEITKYIRKNGSINYDAVRVGIF